MNRYRPSMGIEPVPLSEIVRLPAPAGLRVPENFYWVLRSPAALAGMSYPPSDLDWSEFPVLGFQHLVRLEPANRPPDPLRLAFDQRLEDLAHGGAPRDPEQEERLVLEAAGQVIELVNRGEGVVVHCHGGTGRTGTVIGCALVGLGLEAKGVASYLDDLMHLRGSWRRWPEAPWQREVLERFRRA